MASLIASEPTIVSTTFQQLPSFDSVYSIMQGPSLDTIPRIRKDIIVTETIAYAYRDKAVPLSAVGEAFLSIEEAELHVSFCGDWPKCGLLPLL
jgi:hypothetical protein